ncbi:DUF2628 domain-containing protein [Novosphingobium sp. BL-52-GroH]|uniref:DUF2628 domain-containing protein n=1 Tax=Novosphingobium sp. BL-52-GroH TaxID=3349877 RepID=UPI00384BB304
MRSFNVFSDDDGDYRAVKRGWCWPAFFFGSIWALFSGLWLAAFLLLPIDFVFSIAGNSANGSFDLDDRYDETTRLVVLAVFSIPLAIRVFLGIFGNSWRARKLCRLGFSHVGRVKADGKEHAISLCKAGSNAEVSPSHDEYPAQTRNEPRGGMAPADDVATHSTTADDNPSHAMDRFLLIFATIIGIAACTSLVGLLPAGILLFGLAMSLKGGNTAHLKTSTKLVSGVGKALLVLSAAVGCLFFVLFLSAGSHELFYRDSVSFYPGRVSLAAFILAALSWTAVLALRYLWLNPLLRQLDAIRSFLFGIQMPKRPKVQKIMSRDGLQPYSVADEIAKWKALYDQGVIDDDEYRQARSRLLNPT